MPKKIKILESFYLMLLVIIFFLIIYYQFMYNTFKEIILSLALFISAYALYNLYQKEAAKNNREFEVLKLDKEVLRQDKIGLEEKIEEAFKHIGKLNVQVEEIHSVFNDIKKYPENKNDLKYILNFLTSKVLALTDADWVSFKIIDPTAHKILAEHHKARGHHGQDQGIVRIELDTRSLLAKEAPSGHTLVWSWSDKEGLNLRVFCILPKEELSREEKVFIKAIVNQLEMFYLIFSSSNPQKKKVSSIEWENKLPSRHL